MPIKTCQTCKKEFKTRSNKRKYCSHTCYCSNNRRENNYKWSGGRKYHPDGYVLIYCPEYKGKTISGGYIMEHRMIMEKHLGRTLRHEETVHHINGIRDDNRIENLQLFSSNGEHTKYAHHDAINKARSVQNRVAGSTLITKQCLSCGSVFRSRPKSNETFYCSLECFNKTQKR